MFILSSFAILGPGHSLAKTFYQLAEDQAFADIEAGGYHHLTLTNTDDILLIKVSSPSKILDRDSANDLSYEIAFLAKRKNLDDYSKVVLDLSDLESANVDIISGLIVLNRRLRNNLVLCGVSDQIKREILDVTRMSKLLNIKPSQEEALRALGA